MFQEQRIQPKGKERSQRDLKKKKCIYIKDKYMRKLVSEEDEGWVTERLRNGLK